MDEENGTNGNGDAEDKKVEAVKPEAPKAPTPPPPPQASPQAPPQAQPYQGPPPQGQAPPGWYPPQPNMPPPSQQAPPPGGYAPPPRYYPPPPVYYPPPPRKAKKSSKPAVVGTLLIIVGILGLITAGFGFAGYAFFSDAGEWFPGEEGDVMTMWGEVEALNGTPIEGASVSIVGTSIETTTDDEGNYILYNVPVGDQTVRVASDGFTTLNYRLTVIGDPFTFDSPDQDLYENFVLAPGTGEVTTGNWFNEDIFNFGSVLVVCMVIVTITSIVALLSAFYAFKRRNLMIVVIGCVAGIFTIGLGIGTVLAFIALFILLLSIDEFKDDKKAAEEAS
jgi:hypothetical protein